MSSREPIEGQEGLRAAISLLRRNPDFRKLYLASLISLGGDWFLLVALFGLALELTDSAISASVLIVSQEIPFFLMSPFGGIITDRLDRKWLMVVCDGVRAVLVLGFLFVNDASTIWIAYALLAVTSSFAAVFDPASSAALPNLVDRRDLGSANALSGSLWGTMLAVGAALGGVVSTAFGNDTAFLVDSVSFVLSGLLLTGVRRPLSEGRGGTPHERIRDATVETWRYARKDRRVRALISVKAGFGLAAGVLALLPVFAKEVFDGGDVGFGLLMASRGVGALIGPFLGRRISGPNQERLLGAIGLALAVFGLGYTAIALAPTLWAVGLLVLTAHLGGGAQWMLSTYGLQRLVPDRIRGRIFAADYALITLSLGASSLVASWLADEVGPRPAIAMVGGLALAWAALWWVLVRDVRRGPILESRSNDTGVPGEPAAIATD